LAATGRKKRGKELAREQGGGQGWAAQDERKDSFGDGDVGQSQLLSEGKGGGN